MSTSMQAPIKLAYFDPDGLIKLHQKGLKFLENELKTPCCMISIIGPIRQGKSLLLNYMLGSLSTNTIIKKNQRFPMSDGLESYTHGIHINPIPLESNGKYYYFLDCQGKENKKEEDIKLYTFICLISSLCLFQFMKTITYDHDFLLPYLKSRKYLKDNINNQLLQQFILNPDMKIFFIVRDCHDKKTKDIMDAFKKKFLVKESLIDSSMQYNKDQNNTKKLEVEKKNEVRSILLEDFHLSEKYVFNLPYYLNMNEDDHDWTNYADEINDELLSSDFKRKVSQLLNEHIIGHIEPLCTTDGNCIKIIAERQEILKIMIIYIKMINEGKINNIYSEIQAVLSLIKEDLFRDYLGYIAEMFDKYTEREFKTTDEFKEYHNNRFAKLIDFFKKEAHSLSEKFEIHIPEFKINQWIKELEKNFTVLLNKEIMIFNQNFETEKLAKENKQLKNAMDFLPQQMTESTKFTDRSLTKQFELKIQEDKVKALKPIVPEESKSYGPIPDVSRKQDQNSQPNNKFDMHSKPIFPLINFTSTPLHHFDNDEYLFFSSSFGSWTRTSRNNASNHDDGLVFRKDGGLDMRYKVNKDFVTKTLKGSKRR